MRTTPTAALLGLLLATPIAAQAQDMQQLLGGLLSGNQDQDRAVREAYQRGYQHGREDQARQDRFDRRPGEYRDPRGPAQPYPPPPPGYDDNR